MFVVISKSFKILLTDYCSQKTDKLKIFSHFLKVNERNLYQMFDKDF